MGSGASRAASWSVRGAVGGTEQGYSVTLSADGNTAIVGGPATTRTPAPRGSSPAATGSGPSRAGKLVGSGAVGPAEQGYAVALSGDRSTAIVGGYFDSSQAGAAWAFIEPVLRPNSHDYNGDGKSDIAWRDTSGDIAAWLMNGAALSSSGSLGGVSGTWSIVGQRDFDGDLKCRSAVARYERQHRHLVSRRHTGRLRRQPSVSSPPRGTSSRRPISTATARATFYGETLAVISPCGS